MVATATALSNGGTRSWSFASSSAMSAGSRSRRVETAWPNFTKIGPELLEREPQALAAGRAARCAETRSTATDRTGSEKGRYRCVARTKSSSP